MLLYYNLISTDWACVKKNVIGAVIRMQKTDLSLAVIKKHHPKFPVVGIGASAGGLAAFEAFFFRFSKRFRSRHGFYTGTAS